MADSSAQSPKQKSATESSDRSDSTSPHSADSEVKDNIPKSISPDPSTICLFREGIEAAKKAGKLEESK
ncbi:hypothetical protein VKT23_018155 [Stygiomarasmius scandens]|uniref:Uncharacterized protein n=1 Tax=Marasmiellus scandens TaxID=2682957 RepID=A0ABR1IT16_9AGAR